MRQVPQIFSQFSNIEPEPRLKAMKIHHFKQMKEQQQKISMLTCYDYPSARIIAESKIDCILVGDSVAMAVHGHPNTIMATMEMMEFHTAAVARGLGRQFLVTDLPFLAHRISYSDTVQNVKRLMQVGAQAIKIEGADEEVYKTISGLVTAGIPVMGHIGLTPQSIHKLGGNKIQGKNKNQASILINAAVRLEEAGCFAIVLECIPESLASTITHKLTIPTIGIGAGAKTDGQVLVWHDMLGLQTEFKPQFLKHFAQAKSVLLEGIDNYNSAVKNVSFPSSEHSFSD